MRTIHNDTADGKHDTTKFQRVEHLRWLLGNDVLLLAWPRGTKGTKKKWGHLTVAEMADPQHLAALEAGNIGVALGKVSGALCSIDLDTDETLAAFLKVNPSLADSLRTRGARGGNVWVRCKGSYPGTFKIKTDDGEEVGEWRADGVQTIISGTHPTGCDYAFTVAAPPARMEFECIVWPKGLRPPKARPDEAAEMADLPIVHSNTATQPHSHSATQETQAGSGGGGAIVHSNTATQSTQQLSHTATQATQAVVDSRSFFEIERFIPIRRGTSDRLLFSMSGALLTWEKQQDRKATTAEKLAIFKRWWQQAKEQVDPTMDQTAYLAKWLSGCKRRKFADDETAVLAAWRAAKDQPLPPEADAEYDPPMSAKMKLLVALCSQLQDMRGKAPFFLSSRDAGKLLEVPHTTIFFWLEILAAEDGPYHLLQKVSTGSLATRKANEYRYQPHGKPPCT